MAILDADVGQSVLLSVQILDRDKVPVVPSTLQLRIFQPDGAVQTHQIGDLTLVDVGEYEYVLVPSLRGDWRWQYKSTVPETVSEGVFYASDTYAS